MTDTLRAATRGSGRLSDGPCPLAVDMDGTLVMSDSLHENLVLLVKHRPWALVAVAASLSRGKAAFKRCVAEAAPLDATDLPYNAGLVDFLAAERRAGRTIGLFTAADQSIADSVAAHIPVFDVVHGSDGTVNLSGTAKAQAIEAAFGARFAYAGNSTHDHAVFERSQSVILAGPVDRLETGLQPGTVVEARFPSAPTSLRIWVDALRLRHLVKNSLVFVPSLLGSAGWVEFAQAAMLFVLFGFLASGSYLVNDLLDLASDRAHPLKCRRPLASGRLPIWQGLLGACAAIGIALVAGAWLGHGALLILTGYLVLTLAYSFRFKSVPILDVTVLAGLFTLRVLGGGVFVPVSPWLLTFSMLFFFGLALVKRYAELLRTVAAAPEASARGYTAADLPLLLAAGIASEFCAVVIFTTYLITEQYPRTIYAHPGLLWGMTPILLFWTTRMWHLAIHGSMSEDPVTFALKDRVSLVVAALTATLLFFARM